MHSRGLVKPDVQLLVLILCDASVLFLSLSRA